jgi:ketosteroid isomerase-like protein
MNTSAHFSGFNRLNCVDRRARSGLPSVTLMQPAQSTDSARAGPLSPPGIRVLSVIILAFCAVPLYATAQKPQKHEHRHREIDRLEETWRNAVLSSNASSIDSLLSDDYTAITANGTLQTKQDWLASLRSGRVHFTVLDVSDRKVRFYGNTAVVTSRAQVQGTDSDGGAFGSFRYTRVYVRNAQGKWKIVSFEASRIRTPGGVKISSTQ